MTLRASWRKNTWSVLGVAFSISLLLWGLWQLDLIVCAPVWDKGWVNPSPTGRYSDHYFQSWFWKTTVGWAYDVLFFVIFISFWILFASLWTWD